MLSDLLVVLAKPFCQQVSSLDTYGVSHARACADGERNTSTPQASARAVVHSRTHANDHAVKHRRLYDTQRPEGARRRGRAHAHRHARARSSACTRTLKGMHRQPCGAAHVHA
eukprot:1063542-Pleurochrysis_carterae.AAC.1